MKVCMLAYAFYESDTRIQQYATALAERGDEVDVIALRRETQPFYERLHGVNVYRIQSRTVNEQGRCSYLYRIMRFLFAAAIFLARKGRARRYGLIHVHSVPDFLVFAALAPKLAKTPVILDIHDLLPELYASKFDLRRGSLLFRLLILIEKWSISFSDHVIIANHIWEERLVSRSVVAGKCTTIRNYPDPTVFFPRPRHKHSSKFVITYPGTLNWHQGVDVAIRAIAKVTAEIPGVEFHIYGEGPAKPGLMKLADNLNVTSHIKFHDFLPTEQIAAVMAESDLAVEPKRGSSSFGNEAASTKILEFMALRVPLIVSNTKVHLYYYDDTMVKFFESDNELELASCILALGRDPRLGEKLTARAAAHARVNNWGKKKNEYLHLVDSLSAAC